MPGALSAVQRGHGCGVNVSCATVGLARLFSRNTAWWTSVSTRWLYVASMLDAALHPKYCRACASVINPFARTWVARLWRKDVRVKWFAQACTKKEAFEQGAQGAV